MGWVVALSKMPLTLTHYARLLGAHSMVALHELTGGFSPELDKIDDESHAKFFAELSDCMEHELQSDWTAYSNPYVAAYDRSRSHIDALDNGLRGHIARASEGVLFSVLTGAWTAFEILAEDMWKAFVNEKPETLLRRRAKAEKRGTYQSEIEVVTLKIGLDDLLACSCDLAANLVTL